MFFSPEGTVDKLKKKFSVRPPYRLAPVLVYMAVHFSTYPVAYFGWLTGVGEVRCKIENIISNWPITSCLMFKTITHVAII